MKAITENGTRISLLDKNEIKRGGEGKILSIPELPDQVAKIYLNKNYQHMSKAQKEALSVLNPQYFVRPQELIYANKKSKEILGFTMEYLKDDYYPLAAFFKKSFCNRYQIDDQFKTDIAQKLIDALRLAHSKDIIIGDLSGLNVLVNLQGEVKFLDVDSYETPVHSHWGLLFDEIRDYLYQGLVSQKSDFFALAILLFNLFTHLHPFKGIHKKYKALADRMIQKIPVFVKDPDLIIPKCYTPIQNTYLQEQFVEIFKTGKRFLIQINQPVQVQTLATPRARTLSSDKLQMTEIYQLNSGEKIRDAFFNQYQGYLRTNQQLLVYDVSQTGYVRLRYQLSSASAPLFMGEKYLFQISQNQLWVYQEDNQNFIALSNVQLSEEARWRQKGNLLVVLDQGYMRILHLDQLIQDQVLVEQSPVFTPGFEVYPELMQHVGGMQYLFYPSGKNLSSLKSDRPLRSISQSGPVGIACYEEEISGELSLRYEYFAIQDLKMQLSGVFLNAPRHFTYKAGGAGLVFESQDDRLWVRRADNFKALQQMECPLLSSESQLFASQAGIIAFEKDFCYLLNSK